MFTARFPTFKESSSPELTQLLERIRTNRILPSFLNQAQFKLITSSKRKSQLENEPVYATINDQEIRLQHVILHKDVPSSASFLQVLKLCKTPQDWHNIPPLLEGLNNVKAKDKTAYKVAMIDAAQQAGQLSVVMQCLQQVEVNGFTLKSRTVRTQVLKAIKKAAEDAQWAEEETAKSLKRLQQVVEMLENPAHAAPRAETLLESSLDDTVLSIPLEVAARRAKEHLGGSDLDGLVALYTKRLVSSLSRPDAELNLPLTWQDKGKASELTTRAARQRFFASEKLIDRYDQVKRSLNLSEEVVGASLLTDMLHNLNAVVAKIDQKLEQAVADQLEIMETPKGAKLGNKSRVVV
ncbi:hypothetical protein EJ08DRAFT_699500 [Tothia fuscella]|uniref:Uncharacterized protein n=1 Tax=Tothia fuscella TaxID=1048955 RepID=A0A9P4NMH3_9PEZI|nr:hypothetical protein EJ08DRAFT_699500 [Tothia fuscella]